MEDIEPAESWGPSPTEACQIRRCWEGKKNATGTHKMLNKQRFLVHLHVALKQHGCCGFFSIRRAALNENENPVAL